jgi:nicotinamide-nucleotide amidase
MLAEIITIGDEILIGQIVDTNSAWMAQELNKIGIKVKQITSVSDDENHILNALKEAESRARIILITGGLGPTKDDITKKTLAKYFNCGMVFNEAQYEQVTRIFKSFGREVTPINRLQAEVPEDCTCIVNKNGTAPGMWFEKGETIFVSMPGVPYEMKGMMSSDVLPMLRKKLKTPTILHRTFLTQGVGESMLAQWIEKWEDALPEHIKLAYLPSPGMVRLRLSATGEDAVILENEVAELAEKLYGLVGEHIYGEGEMTLPQLIQEWFIQNNKTLALAESCTGGNIAHMLTSIAGSSAYFEGGFVSYSNTMKIKQLSVPEQLISEHGAVSEQVASAMAEGTKKELNTDYALSVTGIAGPDGGSEEKPVGTVWIGISGPGGTFAKHFRFSTDRNRNVTHASLSALNLLRKEILKSIL